MGDGDTRAEERLALIHTESTMGQTVYADGRRDRAQIVKDMIAKHFPGGNAPRGLLGDLYLALGEAETKGFGECLEMFQRQASADNDDRRAR